MTWYFSYALGPYAGDRASISDHVIPDRPTSSHKWENDAWVIDKSSLRDMVNKEAGNARAAFITTATGQEGTYVEKSDEAKRFISDANPDEINYPYLSREAYYTGMTLGEVADIVVNTTKSWTVVNAEIEGLRRGALKRIASAMTIEEVSTIFPISWPVPS